jgi:hypothetical protein
MSTKWFGALAATALALMAGALGAAPIPRLGPSDIGGTVAQAKWVPEAVRKGIRGMSGSAGHDRVVAAHFLVTLRDYDGVTTSTARSMSHSLGAQPKEDDDSTIRLKLNHDRPGYLKEGMKIRVRGYKVAGDEGGTWTSYEAIRIEEGDSTHRP